MSPIHQAEELELKAEKSQQTGHFSDASQLFLKALRRYESLQDQFGVAQVSLRLGDVSRQIENFKSAQGWYKKSQAAIKKLFPKTFPNQFLYLDAEMGLALTARAQLKWTETHVRFRFLEKKYRQLSDSQGLAFTKWAVGSTLRFQGMLSMAEKSLKAGVQLSVDQKDHEGLAYALCGLGGTLRMRGEANASRQVYQRANRFFTRTQDRFGMAYSFCGIGNSYRMNGDLKKGLVYSSKAAGLYRKIGQKGPLAFVLWSLAQGEISLGKFAIAQQHLVEAEKLFAQVEDHRGDVYINLGWGEYFRALNDKRSLLFYQRAQTLAKKFQLPFEELHACRGAILFKKKPKIRIDLMKVLHPIFRRYKQCGVSPRFFSYQTLP